MFRQQHVQTTVKKVRRAVSSSDESAVLDALKAIVLRHQVCYEVWPEWSGRGERAKRIGYCVSICGVNDQVDFVRGHHVPSCPHCGLTYAEICRIAEWITLKDQPDCRFEIEPFAR